MSNYIKLEFYVPETHGYEVKNAVFRAGGGSFGNYDCCCWETYGTGQFKPLPGSNPYEGNENIVEKTKELKVELICNEKFIDEIISALKESHPYETPAFQYWYINIK